MQYLTTTAVISILLSSIYSPANAEQIEDSFGQKVNIELHKKVSLARELRIENFGADYNVAKSVEMLKSISEKNPDYYRAQFNYGLSLLASNEDQIPLALDALRQGISIQELGKVKPDSSIYNTLGFFLLNERNYEEAEQVLLKGNQLNEGSKWTKSALSFNLGRLYFETSKFEKSSEYLMISKTKFGNPAAIELIKAVENSLAKTK